MSNPRTRSQTLLNLINFIFKIIFHLIIHQQGA
jgi:hypothetical protein